MSIIVNGTTLGNVDVGGANIQKVYARQGETGTYVLVFEKSSEPIIWFIGNWKMNKTKATITQFFTDLSNTIATNDRKPIWICPPACYLKYTVDAIPASLKDRVRVGIQNTCVSTNSQSGAYTGQISAAMAKDCGCSFVLVGQAEVRSYLGVTTTQTKTQITNALAQGLDVVFCVNSTDELSAIAGFFPSYSSNRFYIAYDPFKGTTPAQASTNLTSFQNWITTNYGQDFMKQGYYLCGGVITSSNVNTYLQQVDELNGFIISGGSLDGTDFANTINTASK